MFTLNTLLDQLKTINLAKLSRWFCKVLFLSVVFIFRFYVRAFCGVNLVVCDVIQTFLDTVVYFSSYIYTSINFLQRKDATNNSLDLFLAT